MRRHKVHADNTRVIRLATECDVKAKAEDKKTNHQCQCETCGICFEHPAPLGRHRLTHGPPLPTLYFCEFCGKGYHNERSLKAHIKLKHVNIRPHVCAYCGLSFHFKSTLRGHLIVHSSQKNFQCQKCGKSFKSKHTLTQHRWVHVPLAEKNYPCSFCSCVFRLAGNMRAHVRNVHKVDNRPKWKCPSVHTHDTWSLIVHALSIAHMNSGTHVTWKLMWGVYIMWKTDWRNRMITKSLDNWLLWATVTCKLVNKHTQGCTSACIWLFLHVGT